MHSLHAFSFFVILNAALTTANVPDASESESQLSTATDGSFQDVVPNDQLLTAADLSSPETDPQVTLDPEIATIKQCSGDLQFTSNVHARRSSYCLPLKGTTLPESGENGGSSIPGWGPEIVEPKGFRIPVFDRELYGDGDNADCIKYSYGLLPLGICDSGDENDRYISLWAQLGMSNTFELDYCSIGMFAGLLCSNDVDLATVFFPILGTSGTYR